MKKTSVLIIVFFLVMVCFVFTKIASAEECGPLTICGESCDYDNQTYNTVAIGDQCWFKENLNAGVMIGNTEVPDNTAPVLNNPDTVSKWCYQDDPAYCISEGGLYTWAEANAQPHSCNYDFCSRPNPNQGICPNGWHIPSDEDFSTLESYLSEPGETCDETRLSWDCFGAGTKLVLGGDSGFDAIGAGNHETTGETSFFDKREPSIHFWSSTQAPIGYGYAYNRGLYYLAASREMVYRGRTRGIHGFSVRCVASIVGPPVSKNECKEGGWQSFNNPVFKNQGECVSFVEGNNNSLK